MKRHLSSQETLLQQTNYPGITIIYQELDVLNIFLAKIYMISHTLNPNILVLRWYGAPVDI